MRSGDAQPIEQRDGFVGQVRQAEGLPRVVRLPVPWRVPRYDAERV